MKQVEVVTLRSGKQLPKRKKPVEKKVSESWEKKPDIKLLQALKEYKPTVSYPAKLKNDHMDKQFVKFPKFFKQLHINFPLMEALSQMPKYAKFLKELLSNKRKLEELSTVTLSEECSIIL